MLDYKIRLYYYAKRAVPRGIQIAIRSRLAMRKWEKCAHIWPMHDMVAELPRGWSGWPENKRFAFVLTHDIETAKGIDNVLRLADTEERLGFRSVFNFVGDEYPVPPGIRQELTERGFEVGVHGLYHNSLLYHSRDEFLKQAPRINQILKEWGAVGFRSPCMYHNLDWVHDLEIEYDASTFDTDPFEPQPDGVHTIFPLYVTDSRKRCYVELPYTMPQDFTLFLLMRNQTTGIWREKLGWIVRNGGMALMITHPDYMSFERGGDKRLSYPVSYYAGFLEYVKCKYEGEYWHVLPKEMACWWKSILGNDPVAAPAPAGSDNGNNPERVTLRKCIGDKMATGSSKRIWIDLDNSPHVPLFRPVIQRLEERGYTVVVSARHCAQVCGLADRFNMDYNLIGRHHGKNKAIKLLGLLFRAVQLMPLAKREKPVVALSHGSRAQMIAARLLGIPAIHVADYEYIKLIPVLSSPASMIVPEVLAGFYSGKDVDNLYTYPGIKEDIYVPFFKPDPSILDEFNLGEKEILITVRPPAVEAHYHNPESEVLFEAAMNYLGDLERVKMVLLPRNPRQDDFLRKKWSRLFTLGKVMIPEHVVDGLNLIWFSDLVISGGGTMNREAAALGVPVYSIFRGTIGAVDRYLSDTGRLTLIENPADLAKKIALVHRERPAAPRSASLDALETFVDIIVSIVERRS
ncbi:MAG: DUF354 domain-containing protein [Syntrophobacteraceae bacterium]